MLRFILLIASMQSDSEMQNLAVIGAGIGGCSAAYFVQRCLPGAKVVVFDSQGRIGGRILTYNSTEGPLELGAAFFNRFNRTLFDIVNAERLKIAPVEEGVDFAVWNGSKFVFRSKSHSFFTNLSLLATYRLSLARTYFLLRKVKGQVSKLYQEEREKPADLSGIFELTGLDKWFKKTFRKVAEERAISQAMIDEILTPITRVIYSQNEGLGGFAGISSLIGVYSGVTYRLADGNGALPLHLLEASNAAVKLGKKVDVIEKTSKGVYKIYTGEDMSVFDSVIIAAPLEEATIKFDGLNVDFWEPQPYQTVYRKVMRGVFNPAYFDLRNSVDLPSLVLTTKDAGLITQYSFRRASHNELLVTISSPEPLNSDVYNGIFKNGGVSVLDHCWKAAYPTFKPINRLPPTRLDKRLMYLNAIEPSVSSMEISALTAMNAVRMLLNE